MSGRWNSNAVRGGRSSPLAVFVGAAMLLIGVALTIVAFHWVQDDAKSNGPMANKDGAAGSEAALPTASAVPSPVDSTAPQATAEDAPRKRTGERPDAPGPHGRPAGETRPAEENHRALQEKPAADRGTYLAEQRPWEMVDVNTGGQPLARHVRIGGRSFAHAVWAQPTADRGTSQISYRLDGRAGRLHGVAGIADAAEGAGAEETVPAAVFRIYGDGNLLWESDRLSGRGAAQVLDIAVARSDLLALVCESESPAAVSAFAWGNLYLPKTD